MIRIDVEGRGFEQVAADLAATPDQVERALSATVNRMSNWLRLKSQKELSSELKIAINVLRYRMKKIRKASRRNPEAALWFGLNPIALTHLNPRVEARGVRAGRVYAPGAFIAKGQVFQRVGKQRKPIERVMYPIREQADKALEGIVDSRQFTRMFSDTFERELTKRWTKAQG